MARGALPYQELIALQEAGFLSGFEPDSFQPASVDASITGEIYRLLGGILPYYGENIRDLLKWSSLFRQDSSKPLEAGESYLCKVKEGVRLPKEIYSYSNPKSSAGRNDIQVRLLADGVPRFDSVPAGFEGELWVLVSSKHFPLKLSEGDRVTQLRIFDRNTRFDETEMRIVYGKHSLLYRPDGRPLRYDELKISDNDGSLILTLDLETSDIVGYEAKPVGQTPVLAFSQKGHRVENFWQPIERPGSGIVVLKQGRFYIFYTLERPIVPIEFAAEMVPMDERSGEFRSHYAGFIDPGWGCGRERSEKGWPLVLEVRPFDDNLIIRHNQPICKLKYERVRQEPEKVYGETGSNYTFQRGAMLSKHFRPV